MNFKYLDFISNFKFQVANYFTTVSITLTKTKSSPPKNNPTIKLTAMTTKVKRIISCLDGQTTFLSSSRVSFKKAVGLAIIKNLKRD